MHKRVGIVAIWLGLLVAVPSVGGAQQGVPKTSAPVEKLGENLFRIGPIRVDTASREITVPATVNAVTLLEFVANPKGGMKAYESALSVDGNAITFNTALVLIGLDRAHARVPTRHFDPNEPIGDPVEVWVEWGEGAAHRRVGVEQLLFDKQSGEAVTSSSWVYTGSTFIQGGHYLADTDGVLIGFVHSPAPIIENVRGWGVGRYGQIVLNPNLGLTPGMRVTLGVKALAAPPVRN